MSFITEDRNEDYERVLNNKECRIGMEITDLYVNVVKPKQRTPLGVIVEVDNS